MVTIGLGFVFLVLFFGEKVVCQGDDEDEDVAAGGVQVNPLLAGTPVEVVHLVSVLHEVSDDTKLTPDANLWIHWLLI